MLPMFDGTRRHGAAQECGSAAGVDM